MRGWWLILIFALLAIATTAVRAKLVVEDTLEWMVADADLIVRCKPVEIVDDPKKPGGSYRRVTFRVSQIFKGAHEGELSIRVHGSQLDVFADWRDGGTERAVFLVRSDRDPDSTHDYAYQLRGSWCFLEHGRGADRDVYAFTSDFRIVRGSEAIEAELRKCVASPSKLLEPTELPNLNDLSFNRPTSSNRSVRVDAVGADIYSLLWSGSAVMLRLPLDERTEQLALGWMNNGSARREQGMSVLWHLKSERSIAAFREVLQDTSRDTSGYGGPATRWRFRLRGWAYEILHAWGVDVERPAINMPDDGYRTLTWKHALLIGGAVVVGLAIVSRGIVRVRGRWTASMVDAACLLLLSLAIGLLLIRWLDRTGVHEVATRLHDAGGWAWLDRRGITLARAQGDAAPQGIRYGVFDTRTAPADRWDACRIGNNVYNEWAGFRTLNGTLTEQIDTRSYGGPGPAMPYRAITAPVWAIAVVLSALPVLRALIVLRAVRRRRSRVRNGQCTECGYDLRSGHERCPECGTASDRSAPRAVVARGEQIG